MNWTSPADIEGQVRRLWDSGQLLEAIVNEEDLFPRKFSLRSPRPHELAHAFSDVQEWISTLVKGEVKGYRIVWRTVKHRIIGENRIPDQIWIDDFRCALRIIKKQPEEQCFREMVAETRRTQPKLLPWLSKRPLKALELSGEWPRLLAVVEWIRTHPRPEIYLRQIDVSGVDTKFIERHQGILMQLLDESLPAEAIDQHATGVTHFCRRYGFLEKPVMVRFRALDKNARMLAMDCEQDIALNSDAFAVLNPPIQRVFIVENEINFLAFPMTPDSIVVFGGGYGFRALARAQWLHACDIFYWGDIDTHGFAILDQLREEFHHARSFLMDRETLIAHRTLWDTEPTPHPGDLSRLTAAEAALFEDLRSDRFGHHVRMEQEHVGFQWLLKALESINSEIA